jgi:hypothetical protein
LRVRFCLGRDLDRRRGALWHEAIFVLISLVVHAIVSASERSARENIQAVERSIEETTSVFPFDLSAVVSILPILLPLLRSARAFLPFVLVAGLIASYFVSNNATTKDEQTPVRS